MGQIYVPWINGLLMQSSAPLFVALWSFLLLGERLTLRQAGGICVSLTGVLIIMVDDPVFGPTPIIWRFAVWQVQPAQSPEQGGQFSDRPGVLAFRDLRPKRHHPAS